MANTTQPGFASTSLLLAAFIIGGTVGYLTLHPTAIIPALAPSPSLQPLMTITPPPASRPSPNPKNTTKNTPAISVSLDTLFTLKKGQIAHVAGTDIEIEITAFYNSPCPTGVQCFWSGVGMQIEYRQNEQIQKGMNLTQAFGYRTTIVKTDHETYADLIFGTKVNQP